MLGMLKTVLLLWLLSWIFRAFVSQEIRSNLLFSFPCICKFLEYGFLSMARRSAVEIVILKLAYESAGTEVCLVRSIDAL